jgi:thiol-disulfide isomerase/thioredoxin
MESQTDASSLVSRRAGRVKLLDSMAPAQQHTRHLAACLVVITVSLAASGCASRSSNGAPGSSAPTIVLSKSESNATREHALIEPVIATGLLDLRPRQLAPGQRWVLINVWATWCDPCRQEYVAFLAKTARNFIAAGGDFAAVAFDEDGALPKARLFMASVGVPTSSLFYVSSDGPQSKGLAAIGFDEDSIPYTALVSPAGEVKWQHKGEIDERQLMSTIRAVTGLTFPPGEL